MSVTDGESTKLPIMTSSSETLNQVATPHIDSYPVEKTPSDLHDKLFIFNPDLI